MKIGEARKTYSAPLREFWEEKKSLAKQKKALKNKGNTKWKRSICQRGGNLRPVISCCCRKI